MQMSARASKSDRGVLRLKNFNFNILAADDNNLGTPCSENIPLTESKFTLPMKSL